MYLEFHLLFRQPAIFVWIRNSDGRVQRGGRGGLFLCSSTCVFLAVNNNNHRLVFYQTCQLIRAEEDTLLVYFYFFFFFLFTRASHTDTRAHTNATMAYKQIGNPLGFVFVSFRSAIFVIFGQNIYQCDCIDLDR